MASVALQSKEHKDLLDIIDKLRSKGISRYVDLPEIIVCGEQSAGKSSVLEAISGMSFPAKDNLCTRFATELVLRHEKSPGIKVSITPGPERSEDERSRLSSFHFEVDPANPNLEDVVEKAKDAMGISETRQFSTDTLRVELSGPTQPHLTMVDLPGLFRAGNSGQSRQFAPIIREMVRNYIKRPRSIILAVVSAKSDFAVQEVTELARELDPKATRTLGLITKPDTLDVGSDSEASYVNMAQNKDVKLRLGWHVLKNRSYQMREAASTERDNDEEKFFAQGVWTSIDRKHVGVKMLKVRLSNVLKELILRQLPDLLHDVESGISECRNRLEHLGSPRGTYEEQRRYLLQISQKFFVLIKAAIDGFYNDPFFGSVKAKDGYKKRLRAVVQNTLIDYEERMRLHGQTNIIIESVSEFKGSTPGRISLEEYAEGVRDLMRKSRGRELPGTFNPLIIGELFREQCQPWEDITVQTKDTILRAVYHTTQSIVSHIAVDDTANGILESINRRIQILKNSLDEKIVELLNPHYSGHPITYNHYLTDNVQKIQAAKRRRDLERIFGEFFGDDRNIHIAESHYFTPAHLLNQLEEQTKVDMEGYASDLAIEYMQAYYKVSNKAPQFSFRFHVSFRAFRRRYIRSETYLLLNGPYLRSF